MSNQITLITNHQLPGAVYHSAISESQQLAIEVRTENEIHFTLIDLKVGSVLTEKQAQGITPWHSLTGFHEKQLVLQYFENKKNPDQVSLVSYDLEANELLGPMEMSQVKRLDVFAPTLYLPDSEGFKTVAQFLNETLVVGCEYQEVDDVIIMSYYLPLEELVQRKLMVIKQGENVLDLVQDEKINGFAPGSFFTFEKRLIFVTEKTQINIYEI